MIDYLAEIINATRLDAKPSTALFNGTIPVQATDVTLPQGLQIRSKDGKVIFALDQEQTIIAGQTTLPADAQCTCTVAGPLGNDYVAGQISDLVAAFPIALTFANTTTSAGGTAQESTERMRSRIPGAVRAFSVAGPKAAYVFHALSAHPGVLDVAVSNPSPGLVRVTCLVDPDATEADVLAAVTTGVNDEDVRPITDTVSVDAAVAVDYALDATIVIKKGAKWSDVLPLLSAAWDAYQLSRSLTLATPPIVSQIYSALSVAGVYQVTLTSPSGVVVGADEWARCTGATFHFGGFEP